MDAQAQNLHTGSSFRQSGTNGLHQIIEKKDHLILRFHFGNLYSLPFLLYSLRSALPRDCSYHNYAASQKLWSWRARAIPATPGPYMPPPLLTAPVGFSKTEKIQNTLCEAKWPQEEIRANITESDRSTAHPNPSPISECIFRKNCQVLNRKNTQLHSCGFCIPISDRLRQILLILLLNDGSEGISSNSREKGDREGGEEGWVRQAWGPWRGHPSCRGKLLPLTLQIIRNFAFIEVEVVGVRGHTVKERGEGRCSLSAR